MDEQNPLKACLPLPSNAMNGLNSNRSGRPSMKNIIKFGPQPKSMVAQLLNKMKANQNNDNSNNLRYVVNTKNLIIESNDELVISNIRHKSLPNCLPTKIESLISNDINVNNEMNEATQKVIEFDNKSKSIVINKDLKEVKGKKEIDIHIDSNDETELASEFVMSESVISPSKVDSTKEDDSLLSTPKLFVCDFPNCDYSCKLSSNLIKHKRVHTNEKPYLCEKCCFRTNFVNSLKAHKRTHTAERPYHCVHCSYKCNSSSNLKKHCLQRHPNCLNSCLCVKTEKP